MVKLIVCLPGPSETPDEVCWHNLKLADGMREWSLVAMAAQGWLNINPKKNYQDLEKEFRDRKMNTHLIASNSPVKNAKIRLRNDPESNKYKYECFFNCVSPEVALKEIKQYWPDYNTNFEKLEYAGSLFLTDTVDNLSAANPREKFEKKTTKEETMAEGLAANEFSIHLE